MNFDEAMQLGEAWKASGDLGEMRSRAEKAESALAAAREEVEKKEQVIQNFTETAMKLLARAERAEVQLVQAEQEKARRDGDVQHLLDNCVPVAELHEAEARLATQEATIRQVAQEMLEKAGREPSGVFDWLLKWVDTLQAGTGAATPNS